MATTLRSFVRSIPMLAAVASAGLAACAAPTGSEQAPCYANGTCNAGLSCISNLCVRDTTNGDAAVTDATGTDVTGTTDATDAIGPNDVTPGDGNGGDSGGACTAAGVECSNYAAVLAAAPRGATSLDNCVVQLHQTDCCGARRAYGANHAARDTLCPAEASCVSMYPAPAGCSDATITTDSGETTTNMANVKLRIVNGMPCSFDPTQTCYTCETFVCNTGSCSTAPGIAGGCGG